MVQVKFRCKFHAVSNIDCGYLGYWDVEVIGNIRGIWDTRVTQSRTCLLLYLLLRDRGR